MTAGKYNGFVIEKGADFAPGEITWKDANDTLIDLTGFTARMDIKRDYASTSIISLTTENSRITLGGANGTVELNIDAADTDGLTEGTYKYDLELVSPGSVTTRLLQGSISVIGNVTV